MYWLTIISSIVGILSFVISLIPYFKSWKPFLIPVSCLMIGVTIGILISMMEKNIQQFDKGQIIYLIALTFIMSFLILFIYRFLTTTNESVMIVTLVIIVVSYLSVRLLNSVDSSQNFIKSNDYLVLSKYYLEKCEYVKSADYLQKYRDLETINLSEKFLDSIDKNIDNIRWKGINNIK